MAGYDGFFSGGNAGNARRRQIISDLGQDALRQMNPFRDSTQPAKASTPTVEPTLNVPGDNGQPATSPLASHPASLSGKPPQYASNVSFSNPLASGVLASRSMRQGKQLVIPSNQTASVDGAQPAGDGQRTYSVGTPGQDGYGRISVRPGNEVGQNARSALSTMPGQRTAQVGNGLTVTGSQDAINRLSAPVGNVDYDSPRYQQFVRQEQAKNAYVNREPASTGSPLIAPPPVAVSTGGWKSKIAADEANSRAYGDYIRAVSSSATQDAQEKGANYRAELMDRTNREQSSDRNAIEQQRLGGELALNQASINAKGMEQQKGQIEVDALRTAQQARDEYIKNPTPENEQKYRGAIGKFEKEAQFDKIGQYDDQGNKIGESLFNKQTGLPPESSQGDNDPAMAFINSNPQAAKNFAAMTPEKRNEVYNQIMNKLMKRG